VLAALRKKDRLLVASEARLRGVIERKLSEIAGAIERCGDEAAAVAQVGVGEKELERVVSVQTDRVREIMAGGPAMIKTEVEAEWSRLLGHLRSPSADLSGSMSGSVVATRPQPDTDGFMAQDLGTIRVAVGPGPARGEPGDLGRYAKVVGSVGEFLGRHAMGPVGTEAGFLGATGAAGSTVHQAIYAGGKFLGMRFRPWEAVRYAKWVGNAGRVIGVAGAALGLVATYLEEKRERDAEAELKKVRWEVRAHFRNYAVQIEGDGLSSLEIFLVDSYGSARAQVAAAAEEVIAGHEDRQGRAAAFLVLAEQAGRLASAVE